MATCRVCKAEDPLLSGKHVACPRCTLDLMDAARAHRALLERIAPLESALRDPHREHRCDGGFLLRRRDGEDWRLYLEHGEGGPLQWVEGRLVFCPTCGKRLPLEA